MSLARATQDRPHEILRRPVARAGADNFWDWIGNFRDRSLRRVHCFGVATPTERTAGAASVDGLNRSATKLPKLSRDFRENRPLWETPLCRHTGCLVLRRRIDKPHGLCRLLLDVRIAPTTSVPEKRIPCFAVSIRASRTVSDGTRSHSCTHTHTHTHTRAHARTDRAFMRGNPHSAAPVGVVFEVQVIRVGVSGLQQRSQSPQCEYQAVLQPRPRQPRNKNAIRTGRNGADGLI